MYRIEYSKDIEKDLKKIPKKDVTKIFDRVSLLAKDPRPHGVKSLQGSQKGLHRIGSGNYRIVYEIKDDKLVILITRVSHRKDVYRD